MLEEREHRLAAVHAAIERGIADIDAGRVYDANAVFDELDARYAAWPVSAGECESLYLGL
jgi:antitoxin ParD1/3/4